MEALSIDDINHLEDLYDQALKDFEEVQAENERLKKEIRLYDCISKWGEKECHCACRCLGNEFCIDADKKIDSLKKEISSKNQMLMQAHFQNKKLSDELLITKNQYQMIWDNEQDYTFKIRLNEKNKEELIQYILKLSNYVEGLQRQNKELQKAIQEWER